VRILPACWPVDHPRHQAGVSSCRLKLRSYAALC
jgi:hypothetical protein